MLRVLPVAERALPDMQLLQIDLPSTPTAATRPER